MNEVTAGGQIAFLGTGLMGAPMVRRLLSAGYRVHIWNRDRAKAAALESFGAIVCATPAAAVTGASAVILCLTNAQAIEAVLFEDGAPLAALSAGTLIIDHSTIGIAAARRFAARSRDAGIDWVDAPVSGGVAGVEAGSLAIFVGGADEAITKAMPFLTALGHPTRMGGDGAGQATKLCNQIIVATNLAAIAEAIALGERFGIETARIPDALAGGWADSKPLQTFGFRMAAPKDPGPALSALKTMAKDLAAVTAEASEHGAATPLIDTVAALFNDRMANGQGDADFPILMARYRTAEA